MLGHKGGSSRPAGPRSMRRSPRRPRSSVPVQVNGKVRARLTVAADAADEQLRELALADPQVGEAHRGQDDPKGGGCRQRREPARQHRGETEDEHAVRVTAALRCCSVAASAAPAAGCGYSLAGRGSFLPRTSSVIGVPLFTNNTTLFDLERRVTERVRSELIGRGKYTSRAGPPTGVDAFLIGRDHLGRLRAGRRSTTSVRRPATRSRSRRTIEFRIGEGQQGSLDQPVDAVPRGVRRRPTTVQATDAASSSARTSTRSNACSTEFARALVSAILEAF